MRYILRPGNNKGRLEELANCCNAATEGDTIEVRTEDQARLARRAIARLHPGERIEIMVAAR